MIVPLLVSFAGETSLLQGGRRTATVQAVCDCELLFLSVIEFNHIMRGWNFNIDSLIGSDSLAGSELLDHVPLFSNLALPTSVKQDLVAKVDRLVRIFF